MYILVDNFNVKLKHSLLLDLLFIFGCAKFPVLILDPFFIDLHGRECIWQMSELFLLELLSYSKRRCLSSWLFSSSLLLFVFEVETIIHSTIGCIRSRGKLDGNCPIGVVLYLLWLTEVILPGMSKLVCIHVLSFHWFISLSCWDSLWRWMLSFPL